MNELGLDIFTETNSNPAQIYTVRDGSIWGHGTYSPEKYTAEV